MGLIVQVAAAHICYLIAEAGFELYSDSARICLIGADHWNFPRTYASPEAIQVLFCSLHILSKLHFLFYACRHSYVALKLNWEWVWKC